MAAEPHPTLGCVCDEGRIVDEKGRLKFLPGVHDCAYIKARNALIPEAETTAARVAGSTEHESWSQAFARAMDQLAHTHKIYRRAT